MSHSLRWTLALLLPCLTCALQWLLWDPWIQPLTWFLFYPATFLGAAFLGKYAGMVGGALSAILGWYVFLPPAFAFAPDKHQMVSAFMFLIMAILFSLVFDRVSTTRVQAAQAQARLDAERQKSKELEGLLRERQANREQLSESEGRFVATFEQAAVGIALVSTAGHWLRTNRRLSDILGYSQEELMALSFQEITFPEDLETDLDSMSRMLRGEISSYSMEKRYVRKDGRILWCRLTVALVWKSAGVPDYFIAVIQDIDAQKAAEVEALARTRELEQSNLASVNREFQMIALKREVNALARDLGHSPPYDLSFVDADERGHST
ncbi:MAG: hypothetical protein RLZZ200_2425 [Pseudomonadota bacterium]|jgi:PAS domain S-box-containing protein